MTDMTSPPSMPARRTGGFTYRVRQLQLVLAGLFIAMLALQVFFSGLGVLVSPGYFAWHMQLGHFFSLPIFGLFILSILGRSGWRSVGLSVALFFLYGLQYAFVEGTEGPIRAFHALNALALFWLAVQLVGLSWKKVRAAAPVRGAGRSIGRSLLGSVLVLVGAAVLFGVIFDDGPGLGGRTAVRSVSREPVTEDVAGASGQDVSLGSEVFAEHCSSCHGSSGEGGFGPALAGNDALSDASGVIDQVLEGGGGMPGFGRLSDEDVAAVLSYVRSSWGNGFGPVAPEDVAAQR